MKRIILLLTSLLSVLCLGSCSVIGYLPVPDSHATDETVTPYLEVVPKELTYSQGYTPVVSRYSYDRLPLEGEKQLYTKLLAVCYDIAPDATDEVARYAMPQVEVQGYSLTEAQVRTAVKALTDDHPEIFWTTGTIGYYSDENTTIIQVYSKCSPEEIDTRVNAVRSVANAFYATVPDGLSAFERELMVHDYLLERVAYDKDVDMVNFDNNSPDIYTVYGALVNQVAVCEGYARAFQMLLNGLGVDCVGVMGRSEDQLHMWNAVRLDDSWYQTDVTWDDREEPYARYIYFNVTDEVMGDDHTTSPLFTTLSDDEINGASGTYSAGIMNLFIPTCTDSTMGYYYQKSPHLTDYDGEDIKRGLLQSALNREEYFVFYVDEALDYDSAVYNLFTDYPQYFFDYVSAVNNTLTDYSIDSSNAGYYMHKKSRILAVELHYY